MQEGFDTRQAATTQEQKVARWRERIRKAQKARASQETDWAENRDMCNQTSYNDPMGAPFRRFYKNVMLSTLNIMVPSLYSKNPSFTALPRREMDRSTYKASEMYVNWSAETTGLKAAAKDAMRDGLIATCSYLKVGYIIEPVKVKVAIHPDGEVEVLDDSKPQPLSLYKTEERWGGVGSRPFTSRVSPFNLVRSRGSTSIKNAAWIAERSYVRLEEVKANKFLKNTSDLKPTALPFGSDADYNGTTTIRAGEDGATVTDGMALADPDDELCELWEIWDRVNGEYIVIADGHPKFLCSPKPWPFDLAGSFPYVEFQLIRITDIPYPKPYLSMIKEMAKQLNVLTSYEMIHVKEAIPKTGYNEKLVDENDVNNYRSGNPNQLWKCKGNPSEAFHTSPGAELNASLQWVHLKLEDDINLMASIPDFMRGGAGASGELATVAKLKAEASNVRLEEMVDIVTDGLIEWANLMHMLGKQLCDQETQVRVTGSATMKMQSISKRDIDNFCDFSLIAGSFQPVNRDVQREEMLKLFNLLASFIAPGSLEVNGKALLMKIADLWPLPGMDKIVGADEPAPPADPSQENWLMANDGNPQVSLKEDFQDHLMMHQQFLAEEEAKVPQDLALIAKIKDHITDTIEAEQVAIQQEMLRMQAMAQMMGANAAGAEAQPGAPAKPGKGAGGPAQNGPIRPRQFNSSAPTSAGKMGQAGRTSPGGVQ